jgi:LacI family transcriptional regulator
MRDVAARAGVSLKTVSRVVNGETGVSAALAERVRRAVDELGFRPDTGARSLRRTDRRTCSVALLLEDVSNPFSAAVVRSVEDVAGARGVIVFCGSVDEDAERERELVRAFVARRVDGLLLTPASADQSYLAPELAAGTPVVCVDREARGLPLDSVLSTNADGVAAGVRHLLAGGHRRIGYLGDLATIATARQRYAGFRAALAAAGVPADRRLVTQGLRDPAAAAVAATVMLRRAEPPTALLAARNTITVGAVRALRAAGLEHSVALVGFDDFPTADLLSPAVTVIAQDPAAIGALAAQVLLDRISGDVAPPRVRMVPTALVPRGSGEIAPPDTFVHRGV